ncbi:hypothetical protein L916_17542 [Phytophthora nicotianae]|uniref:Uncharacterized protein n=1 Tax=Phytophthora nicotianae TaxID=4792 RepID=W2I4P3_PHYNI|nr:hypothetical protein L916_17542 [Phytophthora nicotianae]
MHYQSDDGADWRARRFRFANLHRNAINQSRQFDPAFAKEENKGFAQHKTGEESLSGMLGAFEEKNSEQ